MKFFPLYINSEALSILLVGGGDSALAKLRLLVKTEARIELVCEHFIDDIYHLAEGDSKISITRRPFNKADVIGKGLVFALSGNSGLDQRVQQAAEEAQILFNSDDRELSRDFLVPLMIERAPITLAIATEDGEGDLNNAGVVGAVPGVTTEIKNLLDRHLPVNYGELAQQGEYIRRTLNERISDERVRLQVWKRLMNGAFRRAILRGDAAGAAIVLEAELLALEEDDTEPQKGSVALVGAGPGNPELLTLKAHRLLLEADVLVVDQLVNPAILDFARADAKRIFVGKKAGKPSTSQEEINQIIVREALAGLRVVRVKGGDPNIFGRIQEELAACQLFGIEVEVVPGISAAQAASASIKLPLTFRGEHRSITLLTAATRDQVVSDDVAAFMKAGRPFAIYMGVKLADKIVETLHKSGADMNAEVIIVERASCVDERVFSSSLKNLALSVKTLGIKGPAILFIGLDYVEMGLIADGRIKSMELSNVISLKQHAV